MTNRKTDPNELTAEPEEREFRPQTAQELADVLETAQLIIDLQRQRDDLLAAMRKIAYEPFGASDASNAYVIDAITMLARDTLAKVGEA